MKKVKIVPTCPSIVFFYPSSPENPVCREIENQDPGPTTTVKPIHFSEQGQPGQPQRLEDRRQSVYRYRTNYFLFIISSTPFVRVLYSYWGLEDLWLLALFGVPRNPLAASGRLRIDTRLGLTRHTPSHTLRWSRRRIKVSHQTL